MKRISVFWKLKSICKCYIFMFQYCSEQTNIHSFTCCSDTNFTPVLQWLSRRKRRWFTWQSNRIRLQNPSLLIVQTVLAKSYYRCTAHLDCYVLLPTYCQFHIIRPSNLTGGIPSLPYFRLYAQCILHVLCLIFTS